MTISRKKGIFVSRSRVTPCRSQFGLKSFVRSAYVFVAVHAQTLNLIDDFGVVVVALLSARFCDLAAHVLKEVLCKTFMFRHVVNRMCILWVVGVRFDVWNPSCSCARDRYDEALEILRAPRRRLA
jgi:hypothetical protein